ncbi:MAG: GntR family transcriptional regulator [Beijerinckiaceae bacterium]
MLSGNRSSTQEAHQRPSLVEDAYAAFKLAIRESEFPPGHQVSEQEIALRLGMSRTPIHEAALRLQEEGLVRILPRKGIQIAAISPADMADIFDVVMAIESAAAERLAMLPEPERMSIADALDAETEAMRRALADENMKERAQCDDRFHRLLVEGCGNSRFARIMQTVNDQAHRARVLTTPLRPNLALSVDDHIKIAEAIRVGSATDARELTRQHRVRAKSEILPLIERMGLKHL